MSRIPTEPTTRRSPDRFCRLRAAARIVVGLFFVQAGLPKLAGHALWAAQFAHWHLPLPGVAVYGVATLEVLGGALLALGVRTRTVAALLAIDMAGAMLTAGLVDGGQHLILPPLLCAVCAVLAYRGGGAWQLRPDPRPSARMPAPA